MRKLRRPAVTPPTLTGLGKGGRQAEDDVRARVADPEAPLRFPSHWREPDVRGALIAMHGQVCAYCQGGLPHNDSGDVEHFRPKSEYWWLAYDFGNYLLSCSRCNRICKQKEFPRPPGCGPWRWVDRHRLWEEEILLLDPATDKVEEWICWELRHKIYFFLVPASDLRQPEALRVETTIGHLQLNFAKLLKQRSEAIICTLKALKHARAGDRKRIREIRRMASRFQPYGATIRQILAKKAPDFVPTPEEDLKGLVVDLLAVLSATDAALARTPRSRPDQRFRTEILWALAVLWKDPPAASPALIENWLLKAKRRSEVADLLARL